MCILGCCGIFTLFVLRKASELHIPVLASELHWKHG